MTKYRLIVLLAWVGFWFCLALYGLWTGKKEHQDEGNQKEKL